MAETEGSEPRLVLWRARCQSSHKCHSCHGHCPVCPVARTARKGVARPKQRLIVGNVAEIVFPPADEDTVERFGSIEESLGIRFTQDDAFPKTVGERDQKPSPGTENGQMRQQREVLCIAACDGRCTWVSARFDFASHTARQHPATGAQRRRQWKEMQRTLVLKMPLLAFSQGVEACLSLALFGFGCSIVLLVMAKLFSSTGDRIGAFYLTFRRTHSLGDNSRKTPTVGYPVTCRRRNRRPSEANRREELSKNTTRTGRSNEKELWTSLCDVISDRTLVERERITPETALPEGLSIL